MKIPTYKSQAQMTTQSPNVESNIQIDPSQNIYRATKSITNFLTDEYIKEAKLEADNKATLALNELFINQSDGTKGLYSIQAETKTNGKPLEAANNFDGNVNKLWDYAKKNKLQDFDNFTKKALEKKFYATSGLFKAKALAGSRQQQLVDTKKITNDVVLKESLALVLNGVEYLPIYKSVIEDRLSKDPTIANTGVYKQELNTAVIFGETQLATNLSETDPYQLKNNINKFKNLTIEQKSKLLLAADSKILQDKFGALTTALNLAPDAPADMLTKAYSEISKGNFGGNKDLQKLYQGLSVSEKTQFSTFYNKKARTLKTDMQFTTLASNQIFRMEAAAETKETIEAMEKEKGVYDQKINELFKKTPIILEQFKTLNEKVINSKGVSASSFDGNSEIINLILNDDINLVTDKFILPGESGEAKSIVDRYESGVNLADLKFLSNILDTQNKDPEFKATLKPFFSFINEFKVPVEGSPALKFIDDGFDERLNNFKYTMYQRFLNGIEQGMSAKKLIDPADKNFIGKDVLSFMPKANDVFADIIKKIRKEKTSVDNIKQPQKLELETIYGKKLTYKEYTETIEYQNWLNQTKEK